MYLDLYGAGFSAAYPSLVVFVSGLMGLSLFGPAQSLLRSTRLEKHLMSCTLMALITNALISAALIPVFGILGAAIGTAVQFWLYGILMAHFVRTRRSIRADAFFAFASRVIGR
jgi:O-antigen/teichoic acid export membrane protein